MFDVFDPLFFGSWKKFKKEFVKNNSNVESRLRAKISNYMLRRLKNEILDDLPSKYELKIDEKLPTHYPAKVVNFSDKQENQYYEILNSQDRAISKLRKLRIFSLHPSLN